MNKEGSFRKDMSKKDELPPTHYLLYVEGDTDKQFIERFFDPKRIESIVAKAFKPFRREPERRDIKKQNNKKNVNYKQNNKRNVINQVVYENKNYVYGMVDKDFDNPDNPDDIKKYLDNPSALTPAALKKIFITDSHDLETLLISKDKELLERIFKDIVKIPERYNEFREDVKKSFYIAFQVGIVRKTLFDIKKALHYMEELSKQKNNPLHYIPKAEEYKKFLKDFYIPEVDLKKHREELFEFTISNKLPMEYKKFTDCLRLKISKFCEHVTNFEQKQETPDIIQDLLARNEYYFTDGIFNKDMDDIVNTDGSPCASIDFWNIVNGHDLLDALCYANSFLQYRFNHPGTSLNNISDRRKNFEFCLIDKFHDDCFSGKLRDNLHSKFVLA